MSRFDINFNSLIKMNIMSALNKPKRLAGLKAYISPIVYLYRLFRKKLEEWTYELSINTQTVYLQKMLNDYFDRAQRRIVITYGSDKEPTYIYRDNESKPPVYLYRDSEALTPVYLYRDSEIASMAEDFIIEVPVSIIFDEVYMRALVNKYCLPDKTFLIKRV